MRYMSAAGTSKKKPKAPKKPKTDGMGGRPSLYKEAYVQQARKLCLLGATDQEIADFFEVDVRTIYRWKGEHEKFCQALKAGKDEADTRVVRSLYQQAIGYEQDEVKIFMPAGSEEPVYAPYRARVQPNVTAAIFWLKNRQKGEWRDRIDHANDPDNPLPAPQFIVQPVATANKPE